MESTGETVLDPTIEAAADTTSPKATPVEIAQAEVAAAVGIPPADASAEPGTAADAAAEQAPTYDADGNLIEAVGELLPTQTIKPRAKRKTAGTSMLADLEIDFENFSVETERASDIRTRVEKMKISPWIEQWKLLLQESGRDESPKNENSPQLPGLLADVNLRIFSPGFHAAKAAGDDAIAANHPAAGFSITLQGQELKVYLNEKTLVELSFLPKEDEFAIFSVDEKAFEELERIMTALESDIKAAKGQKSSRGNAWKERFQK